MREILNQVKIFSKSKGIWLIATILIGGYFWWEYSPSWLWGTTSGRSVLVLMAVLAILPWMEKRQGKRYHALFIMTSWTWRLGWITLFALLLLAAIPSERWAWGWRQRYTILIPLWLWLALGVFLLLLQHRFWPVFYRRLVSLMCSAFVQSGRTWLGMITLLIGSIVWIARSGWGIRASWPLNWQGYAAPLLFQYIIGGILLFVIWAYVEQRLKQRYKRIRQWGLPLLLWFGAFIVWWITEPTENYFLSLALSPNHEPYYPASDAATYFFRAVQGALGWGYGGYQWIGTPFLRRYSIYTFLNFVFHITTSFQFLIIGWLLLLALTAVAMYGVGQALHSRGLGLVLASVFIAREVAALQAAQRLAVVHVKNLMSEPWLRLFFVVLIAVLATRPPRSSVAANVRYGLLLGTLAAWAALTRVEALFPALATIGFYAIWALWKRRVPHWIGVGTALMALGLTWAPWMWRTATLSRHIYKPNSIYYNSPWFFLPAFVGAAEPEYRDITPTPTPTPTLPPTPSATPIPAPAFATPPSNLSRFAPFPRRFVQSEVRISSSFLTVLPVEANPSPTLTPTPTPPWTVRWLPSPAQQSALSIPIISSLLRWSPELWAKWWAYIGRNVVTSWSAWPWSPRFYTAWQMAEKRPLASGQPVQEPHLVMLLVNVLIWALGWAVVWHRSSWATITPWIVYLTYNMALAFGRTAGGRYIVPIDWIPLIYYVAGWMAVVYALGRAWGWEGLRAWWSCSYENNARRAPVWPSTWGGWLAIGLIVVSFLGVGLERYEVWRADQHPEWVPSRRRAVTLDDIASRLTEWDAWSHLGMTVEEFRTITSGQKWMPVWGFAYFPRFLAAGEAGGEWILKQRFPNNSLFLLTLSSSGIIPVALAPHTFPSPIPLGSEVVTLVCKARSYDQKGLYFASAFVAIRVPDEIIYIYVAPRKDWHCP